jgi:four helix bundle protein
MDNIIEDKSFRFAIRVVNLYKYLCRTQKEFILSKQLLRAGTSIGANVAESQQAQSRADFISKLSIALKETSETKYWLRLLKATDYLTDKEYQSVREDCKELETLKIYGNPTDTTVIIDCDALKSLNTQDCKSSLSLVNLPAIDDYVLPSRITGACIFDEVKTIPEVNCKKKIIR